MYIIKIVVVIIVIITIMIIITIISIIYIYILLKCAFTAVWSPFLVQFLFLLMAAVAGSFAARFFSGP